MVLILHLRTKVFNKGVCISEAELFMSDLKTLNIYSIGQEIGKIELKVTFEWLYCKICIIKASKSLQKTPYTIQYLL